MTADGDPPDFPGDFKPGEQLPEPSPADPKAFGAAYLTRFYEQVRDPRAAFLDDCRLRNLRPVCHALSRWTNALWDTGAMRWSLLAGSVIVLGCQAPRHAPPAVEPAPLSAAEVGCPFERAFDPGATDLAQIRTAFAEVRTASRDGAFCALPLLVDSETLRVYEVLRHRALIAPREEVEIQPLVDQILILEMRHRLGVRLRDMTGTETLAAGIVPPPHVLGRLERVELGHVRVGDAVAFATTTRDGEPSRQPELRFVEEDGGWKLDLLSAARADEWFLVRFAEEPRFASRRAFVERYIGHRSGTEVDERIWEPIGD